MNYKVVLLRHGESIWNVDNRFTGWTDVGLSDKGKAEAQSAGQLLKDAGFSPDSLHTSLLTRAIVTANTVLEVLGRSWIPVSRHWRLNERHYGALQGLNKKETAAKHGDDQVFVWRRSFTIAPPPLELTDPRHPRADDRYASLPNQVLPSTECLADVVVRALPYWYDRVVPEVLAGKQVLIVAHGNSLRALIKHLDSVPDDEIAELNIPTGIPLVYEFDEQFRAVRSYYLGDAAAAAAAAAAVAAQAKSK